MTQVSHGGYSKGLEAHSEAPDRCVSTPRAGLLSHGLCHLGLWVPCAGYGALSGPQGQPVRHREGPGGWPMCPMVEETVLA